MNLVDKLKTEVERYQNKGFLKAAMAVCALTALADGKVTLSGRYRIDAIIETMERLRIYDPHKAVAILDEFVDDLKSDREGAAPVLAQKIGRYATDYKSARTLLQGSSTSGKRPCRSSEHRTDDRPLPPVRAASGG